MASNMLDSMLYRNVFSTPAMREIFDDKTIMQNWLDLEAALAQTQAEMGIIPKAAAEEITKKAKVENLDISQIEAGINQVGHSLVPTLRNLEHICENGYGEYIHLGATTQDVLDTGFMLSIKRGFEMIYNDLQEVELATIGLMERYADTIMAGRTHGQQAIPITFGYKAAVWGSEIRRDIERMKDCRKRCFVGQLSGAVGTMAGFGERGVEVSSRTLEKLDLDIPDIAWHSSRDRMSEITSVLAMVSCTLARIGREIVCLQKTEFSELAEGFVPGMVGSSTMPHKRNPNAPEGIQTLAKLVKANAEITFDSMLCEHERDGAMWKIEWKSVNEAVIMTGAVVTKAKKLLANLTVNEKRMRKNLDLLKGLMMSEPVMLLLGEKVGKQTAHEIVYQVAMACFEEDRDFLEMLLEKDVIRKNVSREELERVMDPAKYTGQSSYFAHKIAAELTRLRQED